ncbi:thrombospondin type 3 repeat-containing protein [Croceitalea rosinachiae]|uniref:Thrombospondin type 3 repeat-containing protein n=1 Tax=Croceitalea rosinachiae TaxID=3075596 RepID=A0ABU3A9N1_9FLAO|nr:thrombospondin type 3 repeat-containing protein [Croceitalea sp. F388]MDT0606895.1 thrombospondin type 3 repeat-containing protein [Croceitalea sp. F388]
MKKILLLLCFLTTSLSFAQYNSNAPWMKELKKSKATSIFAKSQSNVTNAKKYKFEEITDAFDNYWRGKDITEKGNGYKPFMRWRNYWQYFVKPDGYLPTSKELWDTYKAKQQFAGPVNPTSNWTTIGPSAAGTIAQGQPGLGRINAIAVDPNDSNIWYAGAPAGSVWKSIDGGDIWTELFIDFPQIGVSGIAIDPNDSNTIYIATGDDDASDSFSIGVFKSTDGGTSWAPTGLGPDQTTNFDVLNEIFIDPTDSNVVWVGGTQGILKSMDAGDTWEVKQEGNITDFRLKPDDPNTVYAVIGQTRSTGTESDIVQFLKSTDGGDTFSSISENLPNDGGRAVIGVSPADPSVVYLLYSDVFDCNNCYQGLFKSTDGGETFTETENSDDLIERDQSWYNLAIAVSPTDANEVYTGAINIWKSVDGGDSFIRLNDNDNVVGPAYTHVDHHTLKFFNDQLFAGTDGGLYITDNGGTTFTDKSSGLGITQFYRISIAKNDASRLAGGTQDNSGFVYNEDEWNIYTFADGMDYEIDPSNGNIVYGFSQFGSVLFISSNLGQSVGFVGAPRDEDNSAIQGNWVTPLTVSADGEVYAAYDIVYRLSGNSWEPISNTFIEDIDLGNKINDLEADPNNTEVLYASDRGFLFRSENGGETFVTVNPDEPLDESISDIAINNDNPDIVYVTTSLRPGIPLVSQPTARGVYRLTLDNGVLVSIDDITFDLPADQAYFAIVHQARSANNGIYVGTSLGVYRLDDTLTEWEQYYTNLPNTAVSDLEISPDDGVIVASTYGRSAWISPIPIDPPDDDIKLIDVVASSQSISCATQVIPSLTVENKGLNVITEIDVVYSVNGRTEQNFVHTTNLVSGAMESFDLPIITGEIGEQIQLDATISIVNDSFLDNNSLSAPVYITNRTGQSDELFDFETDATSLFSYDTTGTTPLNPNGVWEIGAPSGTLLNSATSGANVIGTNLNGNYPDLTTGIIYSNCYDLSSMLAPKLSFQMAFDLEQDWDYVSVIYTVDGGTTFQILGELGSQPNWYNSDRTVNTAGNDCFNCPGAQWTGTEAAMTQYTYDFALNASLGEVDLTQETNIIFGILFQSDQSVNQEGVVIDDFLIENLVDDDDDDNDGILDVNDNCPLLANADQTDTDGDGEGDTCDLDDDNDGVLDINDNCPLIANADQADIDGDGIGDVCDDDIDGDGVPNVSDLCAATPNNSVVDVDGCVIFTLPVNNFSIRSTGESCIASNNGSLTVTALEMLNYTATLTNSEEMATTTAFSDTITFSNLITGSYTLCLTVEGQPDYELCYDITITEPDALSVSSKISSLKSEVVLSLKGGKQYLIELNGEAYVTSENEITLPLDKVENILSVRTDKECQGTYEETIVLSDKILVYPNPVSSQSLNIYLGSDEFTEVRASIFSIDGRQVMGNFYSPNSGYINMNISGLTQGIYILNIKTDNTLLNYKIVRK